MRAGPTPETYPASAAASIRAATGARAESREHRLTSGKIPSRDRRSELTGRVAQAAVDPLFIDRWSPRAFSAQPVTQDEIDTIFEAARWAPSSGNLQPWLYLYADREPERSAFLSILDEKNQRWAQAAPVLAFAIARRKRPGREVPNGWAVFDTGASWMALALQARVLGLYTHAMAGFIPERGYEVLRLPESEYQIMAAIAIGHIAGADTLSDEFRDREKPSDRKLLAEVARRGFFGA